MRWASPPESEAGRALQGQVIQPDIHQEAQPVMDFFQDALGDRLLARGERRLLALHSCCDPVQRAQHRPVGDLDDIGVVDRHRQRFLAQALAPQVGQVRSLMNSEIFSRMYSELVSL